jgi:hypothetical protein
MTAEATAREAMWIVNMQCERVEAMFIGVSAIMRFVSPRKRALSACKHQGRVRDRINVLWPRPSQRRHCVCIEMLRGKI